MQIKRLCVRDHLCLVDFEINFNTINGGSSTILIGENGAVIRFGVDLPPKQHYRVPFSKDATIPLSYTKILLWLYPSSKANFAFSINLL